MADFLAFLSTCLGWLYFVCWSLSFYPQPLLNLRRRSTTGTTPDFPLINILGFSAYAITTSTFLYSPLIRRQYAARHPHSPSPTVRANDVAFAVHALVLSIVTYSQFWLWGFRTDRRRGRSWVFGVFVGAVLAVAVASIIVSSNGGDNDDPSAGWQWIDVVYLTSYIKLLVTLIKYIPQVYTNYANKSTHGWSIVQILLDFSGGILSLAQLVMDSSRQGDWSGVTGNPVKFGLANVSMFFDVIFMLQHYVIYGDKKEAVRGRTRSEERPLIGEGDHRED